MKYVTLIGLFITSTLSFAQPNIAQPGNLLLCDANADGFELFDLTVTSIEILAGLDPTMHAIAYYETLSDAQNDINPITNSTSYENTINPQTIYVRVWENSESNSFSITNFDILVSPQPNIVQPPNIIQYEYPYTGVVAFDLTINEEILLNGIDSASVMVSYYLTLADAESQSGAIFTPINFVNISNPQTIFVNVSNANTGCFSTTSFEIIVEEDVINIPDANFLARLITNGLDANSSGNIQSFEASPVINMNVSNAGISDLTGIEAFTSLDILNCNNNALSNLDVSQNTSLRILVASNNNLTQLDLSNNPLLEDLYCSENELTGLDITNNVNLKLLEAWDNPLSDLDVSNNLLLERLGFSGTNIVSLNCNNNTNLTALFIAGNPFLETVFIKNGSDESLNMDGGSWFENWEINNNPSLSYVCADEDQLLDIQVFAGANYAVSSYCSFTPGGDFNTIAGTILFDPNDDGCDPADIAQPHLRIDINDGSSQGATYTTSNGDYNFYTLDGSFTITPNLEQPSWFNISPINATIPFADTNNNISIQDFCVSANGIHNDLEIAIAPIVPARPGFDAVYQIVYNNKGNQTLSGDFEFTYDDTVLDFESATVTPDIQTTGSLTWNYSDLLPFENRAVYVTLNVNAPTETPAVNIGDELDFQASINPISGDESADDNVFNYHQIVIGAYDPNDITCLQGNVLPTIEIGNFLHYIINFENEGNAPAENVVIEVDVDDVQYDINTLSVLNASHDVETRIEDHTVKFIFNNINLVGSGGHGNILIRIKSDQDLNDGDSVAKKANIYFDYNFPIETNTAQTSYQTLSTDEFGLEPSIRVYPNPTNTIVNLSSRTVMESLRVFDIQGRPIMQRIINNTEVSINMSDYKSGVYVLEINSPSGRIIKRLVKN